MILQSQSATNVLFIYLFCLNFCKFIKKYIHIYIQCINALLISSKQALINNGSHLKSGENGNLTDNPVFSVQTVLYI